MFNGLEDPTLFAVTYSAANRQFTVTYSAGAAVTVGGNRYTKTGSDTTTAHANTSGLWYCYYDASGTIQVASTAWDLLATSPIAVAYFTTSNNGGAAAGVLIDERHPGISGMDNAVHKNLHNTRGTQIVSGIVASGYTLNANGLANTSYAVSAGSVADEDIIMATAAQLQGGANTYRVFWKTGTAASPVWNWIDDAEGGIYTNGTDVYYNQNNAGTWQKTAQATNAYVNYWVLATTSYSSPQIVVVMGQATYATLPLAQAATFSGEISDINMLTTEGVVVYQMTYQRSNGFGAPGNSRLMSVLRLSSSILSVATGATVTGSLVSLDTTNFNGVLSAANTSDQSAMDKIDDISTVKNYVSPGRTASGWATSDASKLTVTTNTTAAALPRNITSGSGIQILSVASADSTNAYVYYDFTLDDTDLNGKVMSIKWDQKVLAVAPTAGDLIVDIVAQSDRTTTIATPFNNAVAVTNGTEQTYFLSPSVAAVSLRIKALTNMADNAGLVISDVVVQPNVQVQGSAIGAWKSYTPTFLGSLTTSTNAARYREVGSSLEIEGYIVVTANGSATNFSIPLPTGYTVATRAATDGANVGVSGTGDYYNGTNFSVASALVSAGRIAFVLNGTTGPIQETALASGNQFGYKVGVPVNELSSNVTLANRAVEEYSSNSKTDNTPTDTTSFAYGPAGNAIPNGAVGTLYSRRVRFQSTVQTTDLIFVETNNGTGWTPAAQVFPYLQQSNNVYGISIAAINSTDYDVGFSIGGYSPSNSTYAGNGAAWSGLNASFKWRVRKVSSGASVGFPVSSANIVGRTDGVAPATNMLGERLTFTARACSATTTQWVPNASALTTLTPGSWILYSWATDSGGASTTWASAGISTNTTTDAGAFTGAIAGPSYMSDPAIGFQNWSMQTATIDVSVATPIYAKAKAGGAAQTVTVNGFAVRIA